MEAVNKGLGIQNAEKYTVNPLVFLQSGVSVTTPTSGTQTSTVTRTPTKIAATVVTPTPTTGFSDVSPIHPNLKAIEFVRDWGIASGQGGKFQPSAPVSRVEILKMAFIASGKALSSDTQTYFADISVTNPFLPYINTARELKTVSGYSDGTFRPSNSVTRIE